MKRVFTVCMAVVLLGSFTLAASAMGASKEKSGEVQFKERCAACHPDGGNILNPKKTLHKSDRDAHGLKTEGDIIKKMRSPGPGMPKFDETSIPEADARKIAEYIIKTFN